MEGDPEEISEKKSEEHNGGEEEDDEDDDMEDEDDNEDELMEQQVKEFEARIEENKFDYQAHVELINCLKKLADLDKLRVARKRMAEQFPLTAALWLDWLQDEIKLASTPEEKAKVTELFELAVKDYLSVEVWLEFVQFSIGSQEVGGDAGFEKVRAVFERALMAGGLHVTKGALLWEAYIEYENVVLAVLQGQSRQADVENQLKRVANLFKRQLSCPLLDVDEAYERFKMWLDDNKTSGEPLIDKILVDNVYKNSKNVLTKINPFEETLLAEEGDKLSKYKVYLEHEKSKSGTPVRAQCLYERALSDHCLSEELWVEYIEYVDKVLHNGGVVVDICNRAIRNCPWSYGIHQALLRALERYSHPHREVTEALEKALGCGFQLPTDFRDIWMTYLEYFRRRIDDVDISEEEEKKRLQDLLAAFQQASSFLAQIPESDSERIVDQFWARVAAIHDKDLEKMRLLWTEILQEDTNKTALMWLEYIHLERAFGDSKHLRKLFPRALQNTKDDPALICKAWVNYERDEGNLESYEKCVTKTGERMKQFREQKAKEEVKLAEAQRATDGKRQKRAGLGYKEKKGGKSEQEPNERKAEKPLPVLGKRKMIEKSEDVSPTKKARQDTSEDIVNKLLDEKKDHGVTIKHDSAKDNRTVFVSNLDFSTEESAVRSALEPCGTITDLRLVRDFKGRSKGYCYVEFEKIKEAAAALKADRQLIGNRPMFVSKCDPDKETRMSGFKYSSTIEKNKLFVRGLPFTTTVEDLRTAFSPFGTLKDVRLVTYRNGHSKGLAYVDFEDDVSAAQAIIKLDGTTMGEKEISVAISNPPGRKAEVVASLGGGPKESGPRGRARTQISFLPRSLQLNTTSSLANLSINSPNPTTSPADTNKLTNDDFRKILNPS